MKISDVTRTIAGVEHSRFATQEIRDELTRKSIESNVEISHRYSECAICEHLKEEFKLLGITIVDKTPVCNMCGCSLSNKIPLSIFHCPVDKW